MNKQTTTPNRSALALLIKATFTAVLFPVLFLLVDVHTSDAGSATWKLSPVDSSWTNPNNWEPATVPNGVQDVATFGATNISNISVPSSITVAGIHFTAGASAYTITMNVLFNGYLFDMKSQGVTNDSGVMQNFVLTPSISGAPLVYLEGASTAGTNITYTLFPTTYMFLYDQTTLGEASVILNGSSSSSSPGASLTLEENATGGTSTITANGATASSGGVGIVMYFDNSSSGDGTIIANAGTSGGGGAIVQLSNNSRGGAPRLQVNGNASVSLTAHSTRPVVTFGSLNGDGQLQGSFQLGANNLSSTFAGAQFGACTKVGHGSLTLNGDSNGFGYYILQQGIMSLENVSGSAVGTGTIAALGGQLRGTGSTNGPTNIGGGPSNTFLKPGVKAHDAATISMLGGLTFNAKAVYACDLNATNQSTDKVVVGSAGVAINTGATFQLLTTGNSTLPVGKVFTVIDNTSTAAISGQFDNLPEGMILTAKGNKLQASYIGGDGNDLTMTVVP